MTANRQVEKVPVDRLRDMIVTEERLRREVARDEEFRTAHPAAWFALESARRVANMDTTAINRRLRALGLPPLSLSPSLVQRKQKLRRLEAQNAARIAAFRAGPSKSGASRDGTALARSRPRRT